MPAPFAPLFKTGYTRALVRNVEDLIVAQQAAALVFAAGDIAQPPAPFEDILSAEPVAPVYPYVILLLDQRESPVNADGLSRQITETLFIQIAVQGSRLRALRDDLELRMDAIEAIMLSAQDADLQANMPAGAGTLTWDVAQARRVGAKNIVEGQYTMLGELTVTFRYLGVGVNDG